MSGIKKFDLSEYSPERLVRDWASLRGKVPFTAAQCFDEVKNIDEPKSVSDALVRLYRKGLVARRGCPGSRGYEYVWARFADDDFAMYEAEAATGTVQPAPAEPAAVEQAEIPIPASILKTPVADHVAGPSKPSPANAGGRGPRQKRAAGTYSSEAIADALIRKLAPVLQAQFAAAALESTTALAGPGSRVTLRIEQLELTVEGPLP